MSTKLYVGNLSFQTSDQDLQELFAQKGTIESASVVEDQNTGRSRGFGYVEMSTKEEGAAAIAQFNGMEVNGRALNVNEAKPRENRGGGGRGGFGGGGRPSKGYLQRDRTSTLRSTQEGLHFKSGDQECLIEIEVDEEGQPIAGRAVVFSQAEEEQVSNYFAEIEDSRKRSRKTLKEIDSIKKRTQAILNGLS